MRRRRPFGGVVSLLGTRIHRGVSLLPFVAACGGPLPGFYWELDQVVDTDTCHSSPVPADDALLAHLAKENAPLAAKFRQWAEREVAYPARQLRLRHGVHGPAPSQRDPD